MARGLHGAIQAFGNRAANTVRPALTVHLRLSFRDPEGVVWDFPAGIAVEVRFHHPTSATTNRTITVTTAAGGRLTFPAKGAAAASHWRRFTLHFQTTDTYFVCPAPHWAVSPPRASPPASRDTRKTNRAGLAAADANFERYFRLPDRLGAGATGWSSITTDWVLFRVAAGNGDYDAATGFLSHTEASADIGSPAAPLSLVLDPHWKYFRYVYFERYFAGGSLSPPVRRRTSVLPVGMEGFRADPNAALALPETHSNWTIGPTPLDLTQCLPWILRRAAGGAALSPPLSGATMGLRFQTDAAPRTYVVSVSPTARQIRKLSDGAPQLAPGPERLKYYDLPRMWKSRRYFARPNPASPPFGKFFQTLTEAEIGAADAPARPITFSLDDLVLSLPGGGTPTPLAPALSPPGERVAIFNHRFDGLLPLSEHHGLYNKMAHALAPNADYLPCSNVEVVDNYIHEYPDWTRLVVARGDLFDVFDSRTPDASPPRVVGARAAVRWVDGMAPIPGARVFQQTPWGEVSPPRVLLPGRALWGAGRWGGVQAPITANPPAPAAPTFSMQPFFLIHDSRSASVPFDSPPRQTMTVGRFDMALLRDCNVEAGEEVAVNLHYMKSNFNFNFSPPPASPPRPLSRLSPPSQREFAHDVSLNVARRWNGDETGVSTSRAVLRPRGSPPPASPPIRIPVVWFPQSTPFNVAHIGVNLVAGDGRDNRGSQFGTGLSNEHSKQSKANFTFPTAHESGHVDGLPDEYNERWEAASYRQLSFKQHLAGDPFEPDGRFERAPLPGDPVGPMMNTVIRLRNRYFWHAAEWVNQVMGTPMRVDLTDPTANVRYNDYWLPTHPQAAARRTYYGWPLVGTRNVPAANQCDWYAWAMGKEHYTSSVLFDAMASPPAAGQKPFDGMLVIALRLNCTLPGAAALNTETDNRRDILSNLASMVRRFLNHRFYAVGPLASPPHRFEKCLIQFAPQFFVGNYPFSSPPRPRLTLGLPPHERVYEEVSPSLYTDPSPPRAPTSLPRIFGVNANVVVDIVPAATGVSSLFTAATRTLRINIVAIGDESAQFRANFGRYFGIAKDMSAITAADLQPFIQTVFPSLTVRTLP
ncbi:MAG: hypothetical protein ACKV2U_25895 [Bryobacteraceae bacterium]